MQNVSRFRLGAASDYASQNRKFDSASDKQSAQPQRSGSPPAPDDVTRQRSRSPGRHGQRSHTKALSPTERYVVLLIIIDQHLKYMAI